MGRKGGGAWRPFGFTGKERRGREGGFAGAPRPSPGPCSRRGGDYWPENPGAGRSGEERISTFDSSQRFSS